MFDSWLDLAYSLRPPPGPDSIPGIVAHGTNSSKNKVVRQGGHLAHVFFFCDFLIRFGHSTIS